MVESLAGRWIADGFLGLVVTRLVLDEVHSPSSTQLFRAKY